jgi:hypothetical protein
MQHTLRIMVRSQGGTLERRPAPAVEGRIPAGPPGQLLREGPTDSVETMLPLRTFRSATALCMAALLFVLSSGLPTHHHHAPADGADPAASLVADDHHSHATELVEQADRVLSFLPGFTAPPARSVRLQVSVPVRPAAASSEVFRPLERSPPPGSPRAPPLTA